jgi:proteasome assembly chaperone (PAC2) family protein
MSELRIASHPELRRPILVAAWAGWNDAGESATGAIRFMLRRWREQSFAHIDPDSFYDFTQARPRVRLENGERVLDWPPNDFTAHRREGDGPDLILFQGIEPHLSWKAYTASILELCKTFEVSAIVTLGALLAEVSHARPVQVTGSSENDELRTMLGLPGPAVSRYEGPTGIVGVFNSVAKEAGLPIASMWGSIPHYVNASPNPKGTLALLEQLNTQLQLELRLHDLEVFVARFDSQVADEIAKNPEMVEYARRIEEHQDAEDSEFSGQAPDVPYDEDPGELPDAQSMVDELERFLREQRGDA